MKQAPEEMRFKVGVGKTTHFISLCFGNHPTVGVAINSVPLSDEITCHDNLCASA